jgi:ribosomal-protein-alanine N-acetyltransferase
MRAGDVDSVARIEAAAYDYPWSPGIFRDCLLANYQAVVIESGDDVLGYAIVSIAAGEAHLLNLCIAPGARRCGYGRSLLRNVVDRVTSRGAERLFLEVRPSNSVAIGLYESEGFARVGFRRNYYRASNGKEDAVVLAATLTVSE